jgi:hypothetical protein
MLVLSLHDIPDGRLPPRVEGEEAFYEPPHGQTCPESDGVNILRTPLGSPSFVEEYLQTKLAKHKTLFASITEVSNMGFAREAHNMLLGYAVPRLTHIIKAVPTDSASIQ